MISRACPTGCDGRVGNIEFLGTVLPRRASLCAQLGQPMRLSLSLNQLHDLGVREGGDLEFALRVDRVRVFPDIRVLC